MTIVNRSVPAILLALPGLPWDKLLKRSYEGVRAHEASGSSGRGRCRGGLRRGGQTLVVALLQNTAGMRPARPGAYPGIGALLLAVALVASSKAASEAFSIEPGAFLE